MELTPVGLGELSITTAPRIRRLVTDDWVFGHDWVFGPGLFPITGSVAFVLGTLHVLQ